MWTFQVAVLCISLGVQSVRAAFLTPNPQISDLAQWASVEVSQSCGTPCHGSIDEASCIQKGVCTGTQICNGRLDFPSKEHPLRDWQPPNVGEGCVVSDGPPDIPPSPLFSQDSNAKILTVNGSAAGLAPCYAKRSSAVSSTFTLVFWLMEDCRDCSVLEMTQQAPSTSIHLRVKEGVLCINTDCAAQQSVGQSQWTMFTVRVIEGKVNIFSGTNEMVFSTSSLDNVNVVNLYIGSGETVAATDTFYLYDVRYFKDALTTREIAKLNDGLPDMVQDYPECQCPPNYIDISSSNDNQCTNGITEYPRFNSTVVYNDANVTVDGDASTNWASSEQGSVTLLLDFGMKFQIESMKITFDSELPNNVERVFIDGNGEKVSRLLTCSNTSKICSMNMATLDPSSTVADYSEQVADKIRFVLHRGQTFAESYVISEITITGRCDCYGNANSCAVDSNSHNYICTCDGSTNSEGVHCRSCKPKSFRSSDQFDCPGTCQCFDEGVKNATDPCEKMGGKCICKDNIEGERCDTCAAFTHNSGGTSPFTCEECNCYQPGAVMCSNTTGVCTCKANTLPPRCDVCKENHYGLDSLEGCRPCGCVTAGTKNQNASCNEVTGECNCKDNVEGLQCGECKDGFYKLEIANLKGCEACKCHPVGIEHNTCDKTTGQCPCRGEIYVDRECTPVIGSVDPQYGPQTGGTMVTITGQLLGNETHNLVVFLGNTAHDPEVVTDQFVIFRTTKYNSSALAIAQMKLSWDGVDRPMSLTQSFTYKPDPVLDTNKSASIVTFASGGCRVRIYGTHLLSVKYPKLEVRNKNIPNNSSVAVCRHNYDHILCGTPNVEEFYTSSSDEFEMTALLDGVTSSSVGSIEVKPDPELKTMGEIDFQYPFEDTIVIHGKGLLTACEKEEYSVFLGVVSCHIVHISDTEIECEPPGSPPSGAKRHTINVVIGNIRKDVGTLKYLELYETNGFIIIISCIAALILIVIGAIIIFCCCQFRRKHRSASPPAVNNDTKELVAVENNAMNTYTEMPCEDSPILSNGHSGTIQKETLIREPKKGIVNSEAEDAVLTEEFLPKVEHGIREDIRLCFIGGGHFALGRHCFIKGQQARLVDGSLQKGGSKAQKLTIKSVINPIKGAQVPTWANLALSECLRLRRHNHSHVLSIIGIGVDQERFHILYPYMSQSILKTVVSDTDKDYSVRQLLSFAQQVGEGIEFLASKDITHKDVAARNCMVDEYSVVKLGDASFSWDFYPDEYTYDEQRERYLPVRWMAPESLTDGYYDMRTDVWSFAVLVWELLTRGCLPFHEVTTADEVREYILHGYILGKPDTLSDEMYELLRSCWSPENEVRPSVAAVSRSLADMLESDDDGTYANAGAVASFMSQHSSGMAATPRQHTGGTDNIYSTASLSRV